MIKFTLFLSIIIAAQALANRHQRIDTLGSSPKGQYIALEEYGYREERHAYYVTIKILNVWTKKYVGTPVEVEMPAHRPFQLDLARKKAKHLATQDLKKFKISG